MAGLHQRRPVFIISALLILTGLAIFIYKATRLDLPLAPAAQSDIWTVEARVSFMGNGGPVKATMHIPESPPGFGILNENFVSRGFGLTTTTENNNRQVVWAKRRVRGRQALYYRATVYQDSSVEGSRELLAFPAVPQLEQPFATALQELVVGTRERSADIVSFTSEMLRQLNSPVPDENVALFIQNRSGALEMARVAQTLLAGAKIPTRIVHGIQLRDVTGMVSMTPWLEVQLGSRWEYFKPETGELFSPGNHLMWYSGDESLVSLSNASDVETHVYVSREIVSSIAVAERRAAALDSHAIEFSLLALPIRTQSVYAVLLMIPLGALVMVIMRNIIGVPTFGTFTPILVALAFRETQLLYGVILFTLVVAMGLAIRSYLERLRLLLVPRLAAVLTVVVMLMLTISILSQRLDLETGLSIALFPMVILTMVIERMSIVWEERGSKAAMTEGVGSLIVAVAAYLIMSIDKLEHLMFVFPELLLVLLGISLLLGRYTGYRASELFRFGELARKTS